MDGDLLVVVSVGLVVEVIELVSMVDLTLVASVEVVEVEIEETLDAVVE